MGVHYCDSFKACVCKSSALLLVGGGPMSPCGEPESPCLPHILPQPFPSYLRPKQGVRDLGPRPGTRLSLRETAKSGEYSFCIRLTGCVFQFGWSFVPIDFSNIEPALHSCSDIHLVIRHSSFYTLLGLSSQYFVEGIVRHPGLVFRCCLCLGWVSV